jgi:hypothetical protein
VLSAPLSALETRLSRNSWLGAKLGAASAPGGRLREVLDRDRALIAAQPVRGSAAVSISAPAQIAIVPILAPEDGAHEAEAEPIRTRTMARLLAAQGYRTRALAIYQVLLAERPDDTELAAELERLRALPG